MNTDEKELRSTVRRLRAERGDACIKEAARIVAEESGLIDSDSIGSVNETERLQRGMAWAGRMGLNGPDTGGRGRVAVPDFRGSVLSDEALREYVQTRTLTTGTTLATAGKLPVDALDVFIDWLRSEQPTLAAIQSHPLIGSEGRLDELKVAPEKVRLATEATAPSDTNAFTTSKRDIVTRELIWSEDISLSFLEDNIERRNAESHIARLIAVGFGSDVEQLAWRGDAGSADPFLQCCDGFLDLLAADANNVDYDATGDASVTEVLTGAFRVLPKKYWNMGGGGLSGLAFFVPAELLLKYGSELATRETQLGDSVQLEGRSALVWNGFPLIGTTALTAAGQKGVLTSRANLRFCHTRDVMLDSFWNARRRVVEYTCTARIAFQYCTSDLIVSINNIPS